MHTCPNCGQACYCGGDIEDHDTEDDAGCMHPDCPMDDDEEWFGLDDDPNEHDLRNGEGVTP